MFTTNPAGAAVKPWVVTSSWPGLLGTPDLQCIEKDLYSALRARQCSPRAKPNSRGPLDLPLHSHLDLMVLSMHAALLYGAFFNLLSSDISPVDRSHTVPSFQYWQAICCRDKTLADMKQRLGSCGKPNGKRELNAFKVRWSTTSKFPGELCGP
jgi:hypothetical protein